MIYVQTYLTLSKVLAIWQELIGREVGVRKNNN